MRVTHNKAGTQTRLGVGGPRYDACVPPRMYARMRACAWCTLGEEKGKPTWMLAQRARGAPVQKVHCIYKSFIMNYTMVYLKWEACLVRGYMGYRDYNACGGESGERRAASGRRKRAEGSKTTRGFGSARNRTISCRCSLACAHPVLTIVSSRTCTRIPYTIVHPHASTN